MTGMNRTAAHAAPGPAGHTQETPTQSVTALALRTGSAAQQVSFCSGVAIAGESRDHNRTWETATLAMDLPSRSIVTHHRHTDHQLVYASAGVIAVTTPAGSWIAPANRAIWIPAGESHEHRAYGPTRLHGVGLPVDCDPLGLTGSAVVTASPLLRELIIHYTQGEAESQTPACRARVMAVLVDLLAVAPQQPIRLPAPRDSRLVRACRLVESDLAVSLGLEELATCSRASARTLARLFRDEMAMSYVQWRTQLRLFHALRMLADGAPVNLVARRCGWKSTSNFVEVFRRTYGYTPGGVRRRHEPGSVAGASRL